MIRWTIRDVTDEVLYSKDYEFTPYIAELFNTLTNLTYGKSPLLCTHLQDNVLTRGHSRSRYQWTGE